MYNIGIVSMDENGQSFLKDKIQSADYTLNEATDKNQLTKFDGIVIFVDGEVFFHQACEWLLAIKERMNLFVWVYALNCEKRNREVFYYLGANIVIDQETDAEELRHIITNTFSRLTLSSKWKNKKASSVLKLSESNRSILLNNNEAESEIELTRLEFQVMVILYENINKLVTYEEIHKKIFRKTDSLRKDRVANIVSRLRKKLGNTRSHYINTVNTKGYRLVLTEPSDR